MTAPVPHLEGKCAKTHCGIYYAPLSHIEIVEKIKYVVYLAKYGNCESIFG